MIDDVDVFSTLFHTILCVSLNKAIRACRSVYSFFQIGLIFCKHSNVKSLASLAMLLYFFYTALSAQTIHDLVLNWTKMMTLSSISQLVVQLNVKMKKASWHLRTAL